MSNDQQHQCKKAESELKAQFKQFSIGFGFKTFLAEISKSPAKFL